MLKSPYGFEKPPAVLEPVTAGLKPATAKLKVLRSNDIAQGYSSPHSLACHTIFGIVQRIYLSISLWLCLDAKLLAIVRRVPPLKAQDRARLRRTRSTTRLKDICGIRKFCFQRRGFFADTSCVVIPHSHLKVICLANLVSSLTTKCRDRDR